MSAGVDLFGWEEEWLEAVEPSPAPAPAPSLPEETRDPRELRESLRWLTHRAEPWEVALRIARVWDAQAPPSARWRGVWAAPAAIWGRIRGLYERAAKLPAECRGRDGRLREKLVIRHANRVLRTAGERARVAHRALDREGSSAGPDGVTAALVRFLVEMSPGDPVLATKRVFVLAVAFAPQRVLWMNDSDLGALFGETRAAVSARMAKLLDPLGLRAGTQKAQGARGAYAAVRHEQAAAAATSDALSLRMLEARIADTMNGCGRARRAVLVGQVATSLVAAGWYGGLEEARSAVAAGLEALVCAGRLAKELDDAGKTTFVLIV